MRGQQPVWGMVGRTAGRTEDQRCQVGSRAWRYWPNDFTLDKLAGVFASHTEHKASRILEHLIAARDNKPLKPQPLPELLAISDELMAYPQWFQIIVLRVLRAAMDGFKATYRKLR